MESSVIIILVCATLVAWIAYLIYNYAIFDKNISVEARVSYWKHRTSRIQNCVNDLINVIHNKFPKSTIQYIHNDAIDEIEGEIKY